MSTLARRPASPMSEMLDWLESNTPFSFTASGLSPYLRIEDFFDEGDYVIRAEMAGIDPDKDIEVSVDDDMLTITGERREETTEKHRREFHYGSFRRSVALPRGAQADKIVASYTDGVLEVRVPVETAGSPSVKIPVKHAE